VSSFFDTNVLVYLVDRDPLRVARSRAVLGRARGVVSVQVLNEFVSVMRGPKVGADWAQIATVTDGVRSIHRVVASDLATHDRALDYARRFQLHVYDANIIAAAVLAGCHTLWSEDMHHGLTIDGLTVRNPYIL
jgi:predicted nucleic acid-binding protein